MFLSIDVAMMKKSRFKGGVEKNMKKKRESKPKLG